MPKKKCISEAQHIPLAAKEDDCLILTPRPTEHKLANDRQLRSKDNFYIPMRFSGLMQAERRPSSLSSVTNKRLRKQIVFEIGDTLHSGPTHLVQNDIKNDEAGTVNKCVFPSGTQEAGECALLDRNCPADIPSKHCSSSSTPLSPPSCGKGLLHPPLPTTLCDVVLPPSGPCLSQSKCKVNATVDSKAPLLAVQVPEAIVPKATVPLYDALAVTRISVNEAAVPDVTVSEAALPGVTLCEAALTNVPVTKGSPNVPAINVATKIRNIELPSVLESVIIKKEPCDVFDSVLKDSLDVTIPSLNLSVDIKPVITENREMVRLIQEVDSRIDSFCQKRSSRASKRFGSSEIEDIEIKTEPMSRAKRCTRTRKSSCRSDKSESETSESRSVAEDPLSFDMVDKSVKRGKPKNGESLLDEVATHTNAKYNGDVGVDLVNGAHKVKGRRVSRANSDESDLSSCSKSNGNVDHNNDKIDFSLLLEISEADRKKFETKKAKIRRKTADWLLISETEQYYNEKEEIMRNKNKHDSENESDSSDSKSDGSDENENSEPLKGTGKRKKSRSVDEDTKVGVKRMKDLSSVRGRPIGSRNRKPIYDLTMLNDDDDDDENFFGFPVSTPILPSICYPRGKGKGVGKCSMEATACGKGGRKRLSDAERFLRDNREYYHFQETKERLRRSTSSSSSGDKEKVGNGDDIGFHTEGLMEKRVESKVKEGTSSLSRKRPSFDGVRRVTRRTGGSVDLDCYGDRAREEVKCDRRVVVKEEKGLTKMDGRSAIRLDRRRSEFKCVYSEAVKIEKRDTRTKCDMRNELKGRETRCEKEESVDGKGEESLAIEKPSEKTDKTSGKNDKASEKTEKASEKTEKASGKTEKASELMEKASEKTEKGSEITEKATENIEKATEKTVKASEKTEKASEKTEKAIEKTEKASEKTEKASEKTEKASEKTEKASEKTVKASEKNIKESEKTEKATQKSQDLTLENKEKVLGSENKISEDTDKQNEFKDEKKNCLKDKNIGDMLDKKLSSKDGIDEVLQSGKSDGKCTIKCENECASTCIVKGDSFDVSIKSKVKSDSDDTGIEDSDRLEDMGKSGYGSDLEEIYFSFEGVPENECWFQTYQRFIDGIAVNEFVYDEDPLKFILPYEMPKEYIRDLISLKKGLLCKKKNDLADLVRKSPRCHASTLALFSDILPTRKAKGVKVVKPVPVKVEELSSDGTSTPGADSVRMPPSETFESPEELAILALHMEHIMKSELGEAYVCSPFIEEMKAKEETDLRKTPPKKRGKKKRLLANSKSSKVVDNAVKERKLLESSLAHEVDPAFIAELNDDMKDLSPESILSRAAVDVMDDSIQCLCNDPASYEDFSSADENTEASSECVSLCDSETVDSSTASEPKPVRSNKKRRKNLTGWPKAQRKKKAVASHTSDDNDSAIGCDDSEPKRRGSRMKQAFCFLQQTTAQKLAALAANDRRASPRKRASVLYMDTWPVRFRTQK